VLYSIRNNHPDKIRQTLYVVVCLFEQMMKVLAGICINAK